MTIRRIGMVFTLIELLVVVSIIAVLMATLLPALKIARGSAWKASCASNLKQFGAAFVMYNSDFLDYFPAWSVDYTGVGGEAGRWNYALAWCGYLPKPWTGKLQSGGLHMCPSSVFTHYDANSSHKQNNNSNYSYNLEFDPVHYSPEATDGPVRSCRIRQGSEVGMVLEGGQRAAAAPDQTCTTAAFRHREMPDGNAYLGDYWRPCFPHGSSGSILWGDAHVGQIRLVEMRSKVFIPIPK